MSHDGKRWCSQHQGYIADVGGIDRVVQGGIKTRWICGRCNKEHAARKHILTQMRNKNTTREK